MFRSKSGETLLTWFAAAAITATVVIGGFAAIQVGYASDDAACALTKGADGAVAYVCDVDDRGPCTEDAPYLGSKLAQENECAGNADGSRLKTETTSHLGSDDPSEPIYISRDNASDENVWAEEIAYVQDDCSPARRFNDESGAHSQKLEHERAENPAPAAEPLYRVPL